MPASSPSPVTHPCPNCEQPVPADALFCPSCGLSAAASILSETLLGKAQAEERNTPSYEQAPERLAAALGPNYELGRLLGRGGYAEVFTVRDLRLERELAVKVLRPDLILSEQLVTRFRREALAVGGIQHSNIVPVYDVGESEGVLWLLMPLVQGESLKSILGREGHLPVPEARRILLQAAEALQAAHDAGVVHRDIKPENLMIDGKTGRVMLMDFGIAKAMDAGTDQLTGTGVIVGTPKYMSPEQAMGKRVITPASDQYSLAVVGYQMLSGRVPFEGDNLREVMARQLFDEPIPLSRLIPDIPPEISATLHQALRKDPTRRFASMNAFARSLRGEPVAPEEGGRVRRKSGRFAIQLRERGWLAAVLWTVILAGVAYGAVRAGLFRQTPSGTPPAPPPVIAVQPAPVAPGAPGPTREPPAGGAQGGSRPNPGGTATTDTAGNAAATPLGGAAPATCDEAMQVEDWTAAFQHCQAEAAQSSAARRNLGILYAEGKGVARDDRQASVHLGMAAQSPVYASPDTQAVVLMARRYDEGIGTPADRSRGAGLWEVAAEMGVPDAWPIIAQRYANGDGRRKNDQKAAYWYEKAATHGHVPSMLRLAELLDRGQGVRRDENAAAHWYHKAADARDSEGEYQIGMRLLNGKGGFVKDEATGLVWLKRAAAQGHSEAIRELARRGAGGS